MEISSIVSRTFYKFQKKSTGIRIPPSSTLSHWIARVSRRDSLRFDFTGPEENTGK